MAALRPATRAIAALTRQPLVSTLRIASNRFNSTTSNNNSTTSSPSDQPTRDLDVGELQGAKFKIEPLRREGEDAATMRARLLCPFPPPFSVIETIILTTTQTNPANAAPSNPTSSSQPSPQSTCPP
jgi:hypothetical protein